MISIENIDLFQLPSLPLLEYKDLPKTRAIYFVITGETVLYIGQTDCLRRRWRKHQILNKVICFEKVKIVWIELSSRLKRINIERELIKKINPLFNKIRVYSRQINRKRDANGKFLKESAASETAD